MGQRLFKTERDNDIIRWLVNRPREELQKELKHCDLNSLAQAMAKHFSLEDARKVANGLNPTLKAEFIKAVRIYKGELPFPTKPRQTLIRSQFRYWPALLASGLLLLLIVFLDHYLG